jgi:hypothetical protein
VAPRGQAITGLPFILENKIGTKSAQTFGGCQKAERASGLLTNKAPDVTMANRSFLFSISARGRHAAVRDDPKQEMFN